MITLKRPEEVAQMRAAGRVVAGILAEMARRIEPGMRTLDMDDIAAEHLRRQGATSPFLHYPHHDSGPEFPASTCISINEELVHGIPGW